MYRLDLYKKSLLTSFLDSQQNNKSHCYIVVANVCVRKTPCLISSYKCVITELKLGRDTQ